MPLTLPIEAEANALLNRSPAALLAAMLLDQQVAMEWAFAGPMTIARRMRDAAGESTPDDRLIFDVHAIAAYDPERFADLLAAKPAVHRYPASMARRVQQLCAYLVEHYDGDAASVWRDVSTGKELLKRLNGLPGFGKQKAQIFLALLGKRFGVAPQGWREAAGAYGQEETYRSVADVVDEDSLLKVRSFKKQAKAAGKGTR